MFMMQHGFVVIPMVTALLESSRFVELVKAKPRQEAWEACVVASECGFNLGYFKVSVFHWAINTHHLSQRTFNQQLISQKPTLGSQGCASRFANPWNGRA